MSAKTENKCGYLAVITGEIKMKKRGILMTPGNAQKTHDGLKTVTRRVIVPQPPANGDNGGRLLGMQPTTLRCEGWDAQYEHDNPKFIGKPRYQPGDIVAIKERHWRWGRKIRNAKGNWSFVTSGRDVLYSCPDDWRAKKPNKLAWHGISGLFLPYDLARTHVLIEDVRPEQLRDIKKTPEDCLREGVRMRGNSHDAPFNAARDFRLLWDSLYPDHPFASNPWVWRYQAKRARNLST